MSNAEKDPETGVLSCEITLQRTGRNRLQTDGTYNYAYDNEGNVTRRTKIVGGTVTDYTWDHRNRLTSVLEKPSATGVVTKRTTFVYGAFDRRTVKRFDSNGDGLEDEQLKK